MGGRGQRENIQRAGRGRHTPLEAGHGCGQLDAASKAAGQGREGTEEQQSQGGGGGEEGGRPPEFEGHGRHRRAGWDLHMAIETSRQATGGRA